MFFAAALAQASPVVIYDGSLNTNPAAQGWTLGSLSFGGSYGESLTGGATVMTTTGTIRAGYSILSPLPLDRTTGYRFTFDVKLDSESHSSTDRAGFSLIVLGNDNLGVELGFWTGEIWAQTDSPLFKHGEGVSFDTTQRTLYTLTVLGNGYELSGGNNSILTGALRNYTAGGLPYTVPNFVFAGDDTNSANAVSRFFGATVTPLPEPGTWMLGAAGLLSILRLRRR